MPEHFGQDLEFELQPDQVDPKPKLLKRSYIGDCERGY